MPYIDADYYNNVYMGESAASADDLNKYISRASDLIDMLTGYQIQCKGFDNLPSLVQDLIKNATAAQVEYYILKGGTAELNAGTSGDYNSVTVGSFSYSRGSSSNNRDIDRVSPTTLDYLKNTGLLYQGITVAGRGCDC
jgi:hypothetical protein